MDDHKEQLWQVFAQTGRVQDYLRYRACVVPTPPDKQEETTNGADSNGTDRPRTQYR